MDKLHIGGMQKGIEASIDFIRFELRVFLDDDPLRKLARVLTLVNRHAACDHLHHLVASEVWIFSKQAYPLRLIGNEFEARTFSVEDLTATYRKAVVDPG